MECSVMSEVTIARAGLDAWEELAPYHYRAPGVGIIRQIWAAHWRPGSMRAAEPRTAAVLLITMPVLNCALRDLALCGRYAIPDPRRRARQINRDLRCVARVVVHPRFRGMGLGVRLIRHALVHAGTPCVEALAAMGRAHPLFERAGMRAFDRPPDPATVRMIAALEYVGLRAVDLCDERIWRARIGRAGSTDRRFFRAELQRYGWRTAAGKDVAELVHEARRRVLSQPVYYLWQSPAWHDSADARSGLSGLPERGSHAE